VIDRTKIKSRDRILDSAEKLFSEHGLDSVSIRKITQAAGTQLGSINYHFNSKEELFHSVISRRADILCNDRLIALKSIPFSELEQEEQIRSVVHAFVDPMLKLSKESDSGWTHYCRLISQVASNRKLQLNHPPLANCFDPMALEFIAILETLSNKNDDRKAHYAFQLMLGSTLYIFTENPRLDRLSESRYSSSELGIICEDLITFITAGIQKLYSNINKNHIY